MCFDSALSGIVYIGSGELHTLTVVTRSIKKMQSKYPSVKFNIYSVNGDDVVEKLDNGIVEFALLTDHPKLSQYNHLLLSMSHQWVY